MRACVRASRGAGGGGNIKQISKSLSMVDIKDIKRNNTLECRLRAFRLLLVQSVRHFFLSFDPSVRGAWERARHRQWLPRCCGVSQRRLGYLAGDAAADLRVASAPLVVILHVRVHLVVRFKLAECQVQVAGLLRQCVYAAA